MTLGRLGAAGHSDYTSGWSYGTNGCWEQRGDPGFVIFIHVIIWMGQCRKETIRHIKCIEMCLTIFTHLIKAWGLNLQSCVQCGNN